MDVTHQKATQSALVIIQTISIATLSTSCSGQVCDPPLFRLESGKLLGGTNFANMDMFKWYALKIKKGEGLECLSTSIRSRRNFNLFTIWVLKSRLMRSRLFSTFERVDFFGPPQSTF